METITVTDSELPRCLAPSSGGGPPSIHSPAIPSPGQSASRKYRMTEGKGRAGRRQALLSKPASSPLG